MAEEENVFVSGLEKVGGALGAGLDRLAETGDPVRGGLNILRAGFNTQGYQDEERAKAAKRLELDFAKERMDQQREEWKQRDIRFNQDQLKFKQQQEDREVAKQRADEEYEHNKKMWGYGEHKGASEANMTEAKESELLFKTENQKLEQEYDNAHRAKYAQFYNDMHIQGADYIKSQQIYKTQQALYVLDKLSKMGNQRYFNKKLETLGWSANYDDKGNLATFTTSDGKTLPYNAQTIQAIAAAADKDMIHLLAGTKNLYSKAYVMPEAAFQYNYRTNVLNRLGGHADQASKIENALYASGVTQDDVLVDQTVATLKSIFEDHRLDAKELAMFGTGQGLIEALGKFGYRVNIPEGVDPGLINVNELLVTDSDGMNHTPVDIIAELDKRNVMGLRREEMVAQKENEIKTQRELLAAKIKGKMDNNNNANQPPVDATMERTKDNMSRQYGNQFTNIGNEENRAELQNKAAELMQHYQAWENRMMLEPKVVREEFGGDIEAYQNYLSIFKEEGLQRLLQRARRNLSFKEMEECNAKFRAIFGDKKNDKSIRAFNSPYYKTMLEIEGKDLKSEMSRRRRNIMDRMLPEDYMLDDSGDAHPLFSQEEIARRKKNRERMRREAMPIIEASERLRKNPNDEGALEQIANHTGVGYAPLWGDNAYDMLQKSRKRYLENREKLSDENSKLHKY